MKLVTRLIAAGLLLGLATGPLAAQDRAQTLADIRQELTVLYVEFQRLKGELNTTGGASSPDGGGSMLDRVNGLEAQLTRLTAKAEELQFRIDSVVKDGTNKIGDLEFRLCELEPDCDIGALGDTPTLGGGELPTVAAPLAPALPADPAAPGTGQLAEAEGADFDAAVAALEAGETQQAADLFGAFVDNYPGGPMSGEANFLHGEALTALGQVADAARAYLASFSGTPTGPRAPDALLKLGVALGELGQVTEACVTLGEVANRFPTAEAAAEAQAAQARLGCN